MANILTHYTSFDSALHILLMGKVKFGNILHSNDQFEIDLVKNRTYNYLMFCGCTKSMSSLMWFAYAKNKYGVAISFNLKKGKKKRSLLKKSNTYTISSQSILYCDQKENIKVVFTKDKIFKSEAEYRYLYVGNSDECILDINWDVIESITLTVSTFFDKDLLLTIFDKRLPIPITIKDEKRFNC